jgi:hypothetical protein
MNDEERIDKIITAFNKEAKPKTVLLIAQVLGDAMDAGAGFRQALFLVASELIEAAASLTMSMADAVDMGQPEAEQMLRELFDGALAGAKADADSVKNIMADVARATA